LLRELRDELNLTIILITHNIGIVAELSDRVVVMYAGRIAEVADVDVLFHQPKHPYTQGLLKSVPNIDLDGDELYRMPGSPPNLIDPPSGCRFHPRCPHALPICAQHEPTLAALPSEKDTSAQLSEHLVHCWLYQEHGE